MTSHDLRTRPLPDGSQPAIPAPAAALQMPSVFASLENLVRDNPIAALVLAVGTGCLIAFGRDQAFGR